MNSDSSCPSHSHNSVVKAQQSQLTLASPKPGLFSLAKAIATAGLSLLLPLALPVIALTGLATRHSPLSPAAVQAQTTGTALTIRADVQEANAQTGIVTARGNVQMNYPARQITATSAQAEYFSNERRIVLSGNVVVNQRGNSIKAETITYLIDEARFEALPQESQQVESVYIVPDENLSATTAPTTTPVTEIKPTFKSLVSPPNDQLNSAEGEEAAPDEDADAADAKDTQTAE
ncbi:OstA family protein [Thalassoporum mexicanum PCC 7367]|uniref:LptA/OstA family protein n=1 Tax=Thalassoporum mexicanum TaxID=3457544 RepID=UPI00029FBD89|nr:LptA/OstA family protein [Pseudanabaena sp. PCC 7367]AFY70818.1 OstA family protein [Pseudanabaena sp. PCC 7367]